MSFQPANCFFNIGTAVYQKLNGIRLSIQSVGSKWRSNIRTKSGWLITQQFLNPASIFPKAVPPSYLTWTYRSRVNANTHPGILARPCNPNY